LGLRLVLAGFFGLAVVCLVYAFWASTFDIEDVQHMRERSTVYDMDGKIYSRLAGENRIVVPAAKVAKTFQDALLAREDARFYKHRGLDPIGIARALLRNVTRGSASEGASTITQQLARNSFPLGGKTLHRKMLEAFVALRIEQKYSKEEILEFYMNRIYFGPGGYGIETAALSYFGKHAGELTLGESAMIAGIVRAPSFFSPFTNLPGAAKQRDQVLARMVKLGKITDAQSQAARAVPLTVVRKRTVLVHENYAMDAVERELNILLTDEQRAEGGLQIYTTFDPVLQKAAQAAVEVELRKIEQRPGYAHPTRSEFPPEAKEEEQPTPYLQGAVLAIDNRTGGIRALVGGRDFGESKLNRALMAKRQVGSTFKPFVYAAAFAHGILPGATISDAPIARGEVAAAPEWTPENSDGKSKGVLRAEEGLIQSRNTMSVRVGERAGLGPIGQIAEQVGLAEVPAMPGVYLGTFETTVRELTAAYTVLANGGLRRQSYIIEQIDDSGGNTIYRAAHISRPAMDPGVAWLTTNALIKVLDRGTAASARSLGFTKTAAGKTGTTNDYMDAWFVGYTNTLTCGVWVGLDRPKTIIQRGYGATLALPIWVDVMNAAPATRYPTAAFPSPAELRRVNACSISNELATVACERSGTSYAIELPPSCMPRGPCSVHRGDALTQEKPRRSVPQSIFRSFKKFFGGE
jgi:penicillin-binding protein 1A